MACYADDKDDRVMGHVTATDDMSVSVCRAHCEDKDALYYGTQVGLSE